MAVAEIELADEEIEKDPKFWAMLFGFGRKIFARGETDQATWKRNYDDYIASKPWKDKAEAAKARVGYRCQTCNEKVSLNAHHRTYERLGNELPEDITVLCADCHSKIHGKG